MILDDVKQLRMIAGFYQVIIDTQFLTFYIISFTVVGTDQDDQEFVTEIPAINFPGQFKGVERL